MTEMVFDVGVIGGGASGLVAALTASERGLSTVVFEKNAQIGKKIAASGNGRGNILNISQPKYYGNHSFAMSVIGEFNARMQIDWWKRNGLELAVDHEGRAYPVTGNASTICDILRIHLKKYKTEIRLSSYCTNIRKTGDFFRIEVSDGTSVECRNVIIACGGAAQPKLGGTTDGYKLLEKLGHSITPLTPALTQIITDKRSVSGLAGIRIQAGIRIENSNGDVLHAEHGEVLFTEYGISGICTMQCARFALKDLTVKLDLSEAFGESIYEKLTAHRTVFKDEDATMLMTGILHPKVAYAVLKQSGIEIRNRKCGVLSDEELFCIADTVKNYKLNIEGLRGFDYAQVTAGGAVCDEFDAHTMESRLIENLYATGEILDVDGDCGGYNLMFAVASGYLAGRSIK